MHIFSGVVDIPAPSADNKRGGKPTSAPGLFPICRKKSWGRGWRETPLAPCRVTFVIATIIYSSSPPLFLGTTWKTATRILSQSKRENPGNKVLFPYLVITQVKKAIKLLSHRYLPTLDFLFSPFYVHFPPISWISPSNSPSSLFCSSPLSLLFVFNLNCRWNIQHLVYPAHLMNCFYKFFL